MCHDGCVDGDACGACHDSHSFRAPLGPRDPLCSNPKRVLPPESERWLHEMEAGTGAGATTNDQENRSRQHDGDTVNVLDADSLVAETSFKQAALRGDGKLAQATSGQAQEPRRELDSEV